MNVRAAAFRLVAAAVYVWGMGLGVVDLRTMSPLWPAASFACTAIAVASALVTKFPAAWRAGALFVMIPVAALAVPFEHERVSATKLSPADFVMLSVALSIYLAAAFSFHGRGRTNASARISPLDGEPPADTRRTVRAAFFALSAATTVAFLVGPAWVVPRARLVAAWGEAATEAEVLSALANAAVAMTWAGVLLRHAVRRPSTADRLPVALRQRRGMIASALGVLLFVVAFALRH